MIQGIRISRADTGHSFQVLTFFKTIHGNIIVALPAFETGATSAAPSLADRASFLSPTSATGGFTTPSHDASRESRTNRKEEEVRAVSADPAYAQAPRLQQRATLI